MKYCQLFSFVAVVVVAGCNSPKKEVSDEAGKAVSKSHDRYGQAFRKNDPRLFIAQYSQDAWIMAPGIPVVKGGDVAGRFYRHAYEQMGIRNVIFKMEELVGQGEYRTETGSFIMIGIKGDTLDQGKHLVLWKNVSGQWKMHRNCFNSNGSDSVLVSIPAGN